MKKLSKLVVGKGKNGVGGEFKPQWVQFSKRLWKPINKVVGSMFWTLLVTLMNYRLSWITIKDKLVSRKAYILTCILDVFHYTKESTFYRGQLKCVSVACEL